MYLAATLIIALFAGQAASVPAGTAVTAILETTIKTSTSRVGDAVVAMVSKNIPAPSGVAVPKGSRLQGRVETVQSASATTEGHVRLVFREIELANGERLNTWITSSFAAGGSHRTARYIVFTGVGAGAGGIIAGTKTRVAGILGGALAGFVLAGSRTSSRKNDLVLKSGDRIELQLGEDLVIRGQTYKSPN